MMRKQTYKAVLTAVVRDAGAELKRRFAQRAAYAEKERSHLVTDADREVEQFIVSRLTQAFPGDRIFAEEAGGSEGRGDRLWIVDPLDGTANFVFGVPYFAVSIALEQAGRIVCGICFNPIADELYYSEGGVALLNDRPIRCSDCDRLDQALVTAGASLVPTNLRRLLGQWERVFDTHRKGLALLAPSLNICNVARGRTDAFIDFGSMMEGHAAAAFILQSAGGRVTNYDFTPWDHRTAGVIAAGRKLHDALAASVRQNRGDGRGGRGNNES
jgi:myo-inositol-1(or 4)-monophosphatase